MVATREQTAAFDKVFCQPNEWHTEVLA
jgi:hypothetical protein